MTPQVANAPVSFGVYDEMLESEAAPDPDEVVAAVAAAGYRGIELGPAGFLGSPDRVAARLARHDLALTGAYVPLAFEGDHLSAEDRSRLELVLARLEPFADGQEPAPCVTLAAMSDPERLRDFGRSIRDGSLGWSADEWKRRARVIDEAAACSRARGLNASFHHHIGTPVETVDEIERLLEHSAVDLCLDSGHLFAVGGDPVEAVQRWGGRISYVHVKNVDPAIVDSVRERHQPADALWEREAFTELAAGGVDVRAFLRTLVERGYAGWIVVEQDVEFTGRGVAALAAAQARNRAVVAEALGQAD